MKINPEIEKFKPRPMKSKLSPKRVKIINAIRAETIKRANQQFIQENKQLTFNKKSKKNQPNPEKENVSQKKKCQNSQKNINQSHLSKGLRKTDSRKSGKNEGKNQQQIKRVKFDQSKTEVHVSETMYKFQGQKNLRPFYDPNRQFSEDGYNLRRTRGRNQFINENANQDELDNEDEDEDYKDEKPKQKKVKQNKKDKQCKQKKNTGEKRGCKRKVQNKQVEKNQSNNQDENNQFESFIVASGDQSFLDISIAEIDISHLDDSLEETKEVEIDGNNSSRSIHLVHEEKESQQHEISDQRNSFDQQKEFVNNKREKTKSKSKSKSKSPGGELSSVVRGMMTRRRGKESEEKSTEKRQYITIS